MHKLILSCNSKELTLKNDGRICNVLREKMNLELQIVVPSDSAAKPKHLVKQNGEFHQADMKVDYDDGNFRVHHANFRVEKTECGYLRAIQKHNGKNFIILDCGDGTVRKIGVVSQANKFYLLDRGGKKESPREENDMPFGLGAVEWFDVFSGVGSVKTITGPARFYWQLFESQGLVEPKAGEWIVFNRLAVPFADTTFPNEIVGSAICLPSRPDENEFRRIYGQLSFADATVTLASVNSGFSAKLGDIAKRNG